MKLIIEYGKSKNLITIHGVTEILDFPYGYMTVHTSASGRIELTKDKIESMEILPND